MEEILQLVIEKSGISKEEMMIKRGNLNVCEARRIFLYLANKNYSKKQISEFIGMSRQNVGAQLNTFNNELKIYKTLREKLKKYE